ncbi:9434_t:CDS:2 [Paraglomus occultum]|uniref:9434_t:CDS:1 n=1 Tax=Paraglomus occultum TaxID=144539 RepID=A0A9N8ZYK1_9GLOM|nr:9434_t:CDS:2 [Paraglomus occultum]
MLGPTSTWLENRERQVDSRSWQKRRLEFTQHGSLGSVWQCQHAFDDLDRRKCTQTAEQLLLGLYLPIKVKCVFNVYSCVESVGMATDSNNVIKECLTNFKVLTHTLSIFQILMNMGLFLTLVFGQILFRIFFGRLRAVEIEHLYERAWYAVTETCLAMTIFRDEFDTKFVVTFTTLLFLKIFHWLCQDRIEFMGQSPAVSLLFHVRMLALMEILCSVDSLLVMHAINVTRQKGANMMIMFAFEYSILACTVIATFLKYLLNVIDMRREEPWENKSIYVFYLELVTDFFKLIIYLIFFAIILYHYGPPLHIIRDVYITFRSFVQKCGDLIRYRRATRNMNERYPNATNEELERLSDRTCIICREDMPRPPLGGYPFGNGGVAANPIQGLPPPMMIPPAMQGGWPAIPVPLMNVVDRQGAPAGGVGGDGGNLQPRNSQNEVVDSQSSTAQTQFSFNSSTLPRQSIQATISSTSSATTLPFMQPLTALPNGLIPLFPTRLRNGPVSQSLDGLSEDQIKLIESGTREGLQEQLRILQTVNSQIVDLIGILTQTISVMPNIPSTGGSDSTNTQTRSQFEFGDVRRNGATEEHNIDRKGKGKEVVEGERGSSSTGGSE